MNVIYVIWPVTMQMKHQVIQGMKAPGKDAGKDADIPLAQRRQCHLIQFMLKHFIEYIILENIFGISDILEYLRI